MRNPLRRLKFLPWLLLLQVSLITAFIVVVLEFLLLLGYTQFSLIKRTLTFIYAPPLGSLVSVAGVIGIGALAVYLLEKFYRQVIINPAILWALILCLAVVFVVKSLLPLPTVLVNFNEIELIAIVLGVFWKGKPYWR